MNQSSVARWLSSTVAKFTITEALEALGIPDTNLNRREMGQTLRALGCSKGRSRGTDGVTRIVWRAPHVQGVRGSRVDTVAARDVIAPQGDDGRGGARYEHVETTGDYRFWVPGHPSAIVLSADQVREILYQYSSEGDGLTQRQVANAHGFTRKTLNAILRALQFTKGDLPYTDEMAAEADEDELAAELAAQMRARIDGKANRIKWRDLEKDAQSWRQLELSILQYVREAVPTLEPVKERAIRRSPRPFALVLPVTDLHIGKYSWGAYGPGAFSTATAAERLGQAVDQVLGWLPGAPERILLPVGGDLLNADTSAGTTGRGTPQDMDGTPEKMVHDAFGIMFALVRELSAVAPVTLVFNRGNHDPILSWAVFCGMARAFENDPRVVVHDDGWQASPYQCVQYGMTAIGFHHGDGRSKPHELATVMAQRWPDMWAATRFRDWHLGHVHHTRVVEESGVTLLTNPSLSGSDRYHGLAWPIESRPQLAAHVYDFERGRVATVYGGPDE